MLKVVIATGVPGVGKTTVTSKAVEMLKSKNVKVKVSNFGDYMFKVAKERGWVEHRDEMRKLNLSQQKELQALAAKSIIEDAKKELGEDGVLIVDTHAAINTPTGVWPGLPKHVIEGLNPAIIFVIEASPEEIAARQAKDTGRVRKDYSDVEFLRKFMEFARNSAIASAVLVGAAVNVIYNKEGAVEEAARQMVEAIEKI